MADLFNSIGNALGGLYNSLPKLGSEIEKVVVKEVQMFGIPPTASAFVRLAGLSGALAVSLGAYGSHVFRRKEIDPEMKYTFEVANKYHFIHTLALLGMPLTKRPVLTGTMMATGIILFSGSCYYYAFTGNKAVRRVTPFGGFMLIFAWASMML